MINALLLRPLPYQDADRLAIFWQRSPGLNVAQETVIVNQALARRFWPNECPIGKRVSYVPARRAAKVDPMVALRHE